MLLNLRSRRGIWSHAHDLSSLVVTLENYNAVAVTPLFRGSYALVFLNDMPCMGVCRTYKDNDLIGHVRATKVVPVRRQLCGRARTA